MAEYTQVIFENISAAQSDILVAQLSEAGFEGFEEDENYLKAFIASDKYDASVVKEIAASYDTRFTQSIIKETNWNEVWESNFQPVIVDDFVSIRADFHPKQSGVQSEIIITPKMSFGTGHHATTNMMMRQMRDIDFKNKTVFDFGTGTGVLAILSEKLGAESIQAIDNDEWSIANAAENFQRNGCCKINLKNTDSLDKTGKFDVILANINKNIILQNFEALVQKLKDSGILLLSGLLNTDREDVLYTANQYNVRFTSELSQGDWLCVRIER